MQDWHTVDLVERRADPPSAPASITFAFRLQHTHFSASFPLVHAL